MIDGRRAGDKGQQSKGQPLSGMAATDHIDFEVRAATDVAADLTVEVTADEPQNIPRCAGCRPTPARHK
jgi:hypothetical protein